VKKVNLLYLIFFNLFFIDIKKVSDYIGTRNVGQVRSHLQKIKQKKEKMKMLQNKNIDLNDDNNLNDYKYFNNKIIPLEEEKNNFVNNNNINKEKSFDTEEFDFRESKSSTTIPTHKK
jgi:uncharacterized membrane protein YgaE (UPF0421/DUF939 family)